MNGVSMGAREWGMLVLLSVLWGGSFFFNAVALRELPVFSIVTARVGIAAIGLHLWLRATGLGFPTDRRFLVSVAVMGLINNVIPFSLIVQGQTAIGSGLASIVNACTPLLTALAAHVFLSDEKLSGMKFIGVLLGIAGVAAMMGLEALEGAQGATLGMLCVFGATAAYAASGVFGRRFAKMGVAPAQVAAGQVSFATLFLAPVALALEGAELAQAAPGWTTWAALLCLGLASSALAYLLFFHILAAAGATNISLVTLLVPVSAILLGVVFLGETLALRHVAGMAVIALGLALIDGRLPRMLRARLAAR